MNKNHFTTTLKKTALTLSLGIIAGGASAATCQSSTPVWSDEFTGDSLDTSKWEIMKGDGCSYGICGWGNNELQTYESENITVKDGILTITARKELVNNKPYTSGRIRTANMPNGGEWKHGRFEARIKLPNGTGTWPAFWMLPTDPDIGWPMSGEIDILEATGQADMIAFGTIHYGQAWPNNEFTSGRILKQPDAWSDDFHNYAVEWEAGEIRWYVDDILYSTKTPADMSNPDYWTFDRYNYHFLLNMAVGGSIGGWVDDSQMPQTMQVDYVRVYNFGQAAIVGNHIVEPGSVHTYEVVDKTGQQNNYAWTGPQGQTSKGQTFTVNWGKTASDIHVKVTNSCGTQTLALPVHMLPEQSTGTVLDNYEHENNLTYTFTSGALHQRVLNQFGDSTNSSTTTARYTRSSGSQYDVIAASYTLDDAAPFISGEKAFYLDVYTDAPIGTEFLLQLENSNTAQPWNFPIGRHSKYLAHTNVQHQWQRLKFEMDDRMDGETLNDQVDTIVLLIAPNSFTGHTYYLDNFSIYQPTSTEQQAKTVTIASVKTGQQAVSQTHKLAYATIKIIDDTGQPAENISLRGHFSGGTNAIARGVTDKNGEITLRAQHAAIGNQSFSFCLNITDNHINVDTSSSKTLCP